MKDLHKRGCIRMYLDQCLYQKEAEWEREVWNSDGSEVEAMLDSTGSLEANMVFQYFPEIRKETLYSPH